MDKEPITLEEVAYKQYTLDISNPGLGKKHERFITTPQLRKLGLTLTSKEYVQAYKDVKKKMDLVENRWKKRVFAFFAQLKQCAYHV